MSLADQHAKGTAEIVDRLLKQEGEETFLDACRKAKLPPTRRQARKWLQGRGQAWDGRERRKQERRES